MAESLIMTDDLFALQLAMFIPSISSSRLLVTLNDLLLNCQFIPILLPILIFFFQQIYHFFISALHFSNHIWMEKAEKKIPFVKIYRDSSHFFFLASQSVFINFSNLYYTHTHTHSEWPRFTMVLYGIPCNEKPIFYHSSI
jgi:hypothetical protein